MPVSAHRHRTPSPPPRPRIIITPFHRRVLPLHNQLRRRPRNCRQQPLQSALSPDEFQPPTPFARHHLIVSFRNPQHLINRRHPRLRKFPPLFHRRKNCPHTFSQPQDLQHYRIHRSRLAPLQRLQPHPALFTHHPRIHQELHKLSPRKVVRHRPQIGKIQRQSPSNQFWRPRAHCQLNPF